jgi:hypothetical protein
MSYWLYYFDSTAQHQAYSTEVRQDMLLQVALNRLLPHLGTLQRLVYTSAAVAAAVAAAACTSWR